MSSKESKALKRLLQIVSAFTCAALLASAPADAAQRKKVAIEKKQTSVVAVKRNTKSVVVAKSARSTRTAKATVASRRKGVVRAAAPIIPAPQSFGQLAGLHAAGDALDLKSSVALVIDQETSEVLFSKNEQAVLPIASLTKLMTG
ncbi:MAG: D-alanyl-D-alanine endopeptidase, partial [Rhodoferax sp.]|nr:D-alanyl-D-alanine endopeptidase [Rhodoferax sp.]